VRPALPSTPRDGHNLSMSWRRVVRAGVAVGVFVIAVALSAKDKTFVMPKLEPAASYPAHEQHTPEHVTIPAHPFDTRGKAEVFAIPYQQLHYLPVLLIISNDGDAPISMLDLQIELSRSRKMRIFPATEEDLQRRLGGPQRIPGGPSPLPFPLPHGKS